MDPKNQVDQRVMLLLKLPDHLRVLRAELGVGLLEGADMYLAVFLEVADKIFPQPHQPHPLQRLSLLLLA